jgi:cyclopropane fatty-acyl-phospholipid synthase-like methyltransferase
MFPLLSLDSSSVLADFGCGDGRILIAAVERYGCTGIGIEIDPQIADTARRRVADSGLSERIQIVTGDVRSYDPAKDRVTHAVAYLYPDLLSELAATLAAVPVVASPFHEVPGIGQQRIGDVWIRR